MFTFTVVYYGVSFPVVLNGGPYGVHRVLPEYHSRHLQIHRASRFNRPRYVTAGLENSWGFQGNYIL